MKYYSLLLITIVLTGCDVATLSEKESNDLSNYRVNIVIKDDAGNHSLNQIKVLLSNGEKQIINEQVKILLNGIPMKLFVKNELYYTKTSFYRTDSLSRKDSYYFEIILPDSSQFPLAYIAPQKKNKSARFDIPAKISKNENFILKWTDLKTPYSLEFIKGTEVKEKSAKNVTEYGYSGRRTDILDSERGEYVISNSYFEDSLTITRHLELELSYKEFGLVNPKLLARSDIRYNYSINKIVDIED